MKPTAIRASRSEAVVRVEWEDGHQSVYPWRHLRQSCPCASCRNGEGGPSEPLALPVIQEGEAVLVDMEQVGNYGIRLVWQDGHDDGIYSWDLLRQLCPCGAHARGGGE